MSVHKAGIAISRDDIAAFKNLKDRNFLLIVSKQLYELGFNLRKSSNQKNESMIVVEDPDINSILATNVALNADILFIPYGFINWPFPEIKQIHQQSRVVTLAIREDRFPTNIDVLIDHLDRIKSADIERQIQLGDLYVSNLQKSTILKFSNDLPSTEAIIQLTDEYIASKMYGYADYGKKTLFVPNGEVSITPKSSSRKRNQSAYEEAPTLKLNGELILHGYPVLSRQAPIQFANNTNIVSLYSQLASLQHGKLKLELHEGVIQKMEVVDSIVQPAYDVLAALFKTDERYLSLVEIGYGLDTVNQPYPNNNAVNEFLGFENGCIHFGFGSNVTLYHLDILCPNTKIEFVPDPKADIQLIR